MLVYIFIHSDVYLYLYLFFPEFISWWWCFIFMFAHAFSARILAECLMLLAAAVVVAKWRTTNWPLEFWWPRALNYTLVTRVGVLFFLFIAHFLRQFSLIWIFWSCGFTASAWVSRFARLLIRKMKVSQHAEVAAVSQAIWRKGLLIFPATPWRFSKLSNCKKSKGRGGKVNKLYM